MTGTRNPEVDAGLADAADLAAKADTLQALVRAWVEARS